MKSILSNTKECFVCHCPTVHKHHIYEGRGRRKLSEKYGCWIYLCPAHHTGPAGIHFDHDYDRFIKRICQEKWEKRFGSREDFIKVFNRSYL